MFGRETTGARRYTLETRTADWIIEWRSADSSRAACTCDKTATSRPTRRYALPALDATSSYRTVDAHMQSSRSPRGRLLDGPAARTGGNSGAIANLAGMALFALVVLVPGLVSAGDAVREDFGQHVQPVLEDYCYSCHGGGIKKGGVALEGLETDQARLSDPKLWGAVLKNVRAGLMPPAGKPRPSKEELRVLEDWIKSGAFGIDPNDADPGFVTVRRLNRVEYRNTIRDLVGVDFDATAEFPPDDSGHGFDNIGDVLTMSPLLLEKYVAAAKSIIAQAVPDAARAVTEKKIAGQSFRPGNRPLAQGSGNGSGPRVLSYYEPATVSTTTKLDHAGKYQLVVDLTAAERYVDGVFDYNKCRLTFKADGQKLLEQDFSRQDGRAYHFVYDRDWQPGAHELTFEIKPLTSETKVRNLSIRINSVTVRGPLEEKYWTRPPNYAKFFPRDVPASLAERRQYALELLGAFATRAFRRPVDDDMRSRLADLAEREYVTKKRTFEAGISQAMAAVLSSPRFLFRQEETEAGSTDHYPLIDEYSLASRLSYFLWSTMPDDELFGLAREHKLQEEPARAAHADAGEPAVGGAGAALRRPVAASARR